jgi:hypothetical protein
MNIVDFICPFHVAGQNANAKFRKLSKKKLNGNDGEREKVGNEKHSTNDDNEREKESLDYAICLRISINIEAPPNNR